MHEPGFKTYCVKMANRIAAITPGARTDPFFINRLISHFLNGVDDPENHRSHVVAIEKARIETRTEELRLADPSARIEELVKQATAELRGFIEPEHSGSGTKAKGVKKRRRNRNHRKPQGEIAYA